MKNELVARVLLVEDHHDDAYFIERALREDSITGDLQRAEDLESYRAALKDFQPDVIIADFRLPDMDGLEALAMARALRPETPFIFVTGSLGDEMAAETLKRGASDYILKDRLGRLPSAVRRAIDEAQKRRSLEVTRHALIQSEERHRAASELTSDYAYCISFSDDGVSSIEWMTGAFQAVTGYPIEEATAELLHDIVHPADRQRVADEFVDMVSGQKLNSEFQIITRTGQERSIRSYARTVRDSEGAILRVYGAAQDITDLRRASDSRVEATEAFQAIVSTAPVAVMTMDTEGIVTRWNPAAEHLFGWTESEVVGFPYPVRSPNPGEVESNRLRILAGESIVSHEAVRIQKDGSLVDILVNMGPLKDGNGKVNGVLGMLVDVTQVKRAETALQRSDDDRLRLLDRMFAVQEEERHRIAGDIHDDSVQVMVAASLRLDMLHQKLSDPEHLAMVERLQANVSTSIERLRQLMFELRPPALDRDGLATAIQTYLGRVEEESDLTTLLEDHLTREPAEPVRLVLYRVVQEALTNARKHAKATHLSVRLEELGESIVATVSDDGCGFEMGPSLESPSGHIGISSMRERAVQAGGELSIKSAPGEGTTVEARFPMPTVIDVSSNAA